MMFRFIKQHTRTLLLLLVVPLVFVGVTSTLFAAPNPQINYQGKLTDNVGAPVADGAYDMEFSLYTVATSGSPIWTETLTGADQVQVSNGLFSVMLGSTTALTGVDFNQTLYLGVTVGADSEMAPRKILGTVPAAFEAFSFDGATSSQYLRSDQAGTLAASAASTLLTITQSGAGDILNLFDGGTEVFTVTDGGNVGIGTSSPLARLTVRSTGTTDILNLFETGGAEVFTVLESGYVGIGHAAPTVPLQVIGPSETTSGLGMFRFDTNTGSNDSGLKIGARAGAGSAGYTFIQGIHTGVANDGNILLNPAGGSVGIGLTAPSVNFHVSGLNATGMRISSDNNNNGTSEDAFLQFGTNGDSNTGWTIGLDDSDADAFKIAGSATLGSSDFFTILSGGNVGIGTSSPAFKLDIYGDARIDGDLYDTTGSAGVAGYVLQSTASGITWVATSSLGISSGSSVSFGTDNQIPFTNSGGTDYDYSSNFTFDGSLLNVIGTASSTNLLIANTATTTNLALLGALYDGAGSTGSSGQVLQSTGSGVQWSAAASGADGSVATLIVAANTSAASSSADYVTDGTSDEVEIEAAINALPSAGGIVYLLEGVYSISSDIDIDAGDDNLVLRGAGPGTILRVAAGTSASFDVIDVDNVANVHLVDLAIEGNQGNTTSATLDGIELNNVASSSIERVAVRDMDDDAIRLDLVTNLLVADSILNSNTGDGLVSFDSGSRNIIARNNTMQFNGSNGVYVSAGQDIAIIANTIATSTDEQLYVTSGAVNVTISDNTVVGGASHGIRTEAPYTRVIGNTLTGIGDGTSDIALYAAASNGADNGVFANNSIIDPNGTGIVINSTDNLVIDGNSIANAGSNGMFISAGTNISVTGNIITNATADGINIAASDSLIADNVIDEVGADDDGIELTSTANNTVVSNNRVMDASGSDVGIYVNGTTGVTLTSNVVDGAGWVDGPYDDAGIGTRYVQGNRLDVLARTSDFQDGAYTAFTITQTGTGNIMELFDANGVSTSSVLVVRDGGNIGIGTSTPAYDLDVYGDVRIDGDLYDATGSAGVAGYVLQSTASGIQWVATSSLGISGGGSSVSFGTDSQIPFMNSGGTDFEYSANYSFDESTDTLTVGNLTLSDGLTTHTGAATTTVVDNNPYAWTIATSTTARPLFRIDTTSGSESIVIGGGGNSDILIGDIGEPANLVFEESSTISGQGANTITFGEAGDIFNFAVNLGIGTSTPAYALDIYGDARIDGDLYDATGSAGVAGYVLQSTASGIQWVATSSLNISGGSSVSFGTNSQIPFMNSGGTDFEYSANYSFDESIDTLTIGNLTLADGLFAHTGSATTTIPNGVRNAWTIATSSTGSPLFSISTDGSPEVTFGTPGGQVLIGSVGSGSNLVFEESSTISGQGANTITFGEAGDIFNFAVNLGIGSTSPQQELSIDGDMSLTGAFYDSLYSSGTNGMVLWSTSTGTEWVSTSTLNIMASQWSTGSGLIYYDGGDVGVGLVDPDKRLEVFETVADAQLKISYDATRYAQFQVDSVGDLIVDAQGGDVRMNDENLWVCSGGSCPTGAPAGTGNLIVENRLGVGTSSPREGVEIWDDLYVANGGATGAGQATSTFQGDVLILGKLDVGTIDPIYTVGGTKYATYGMSSIGIKEEVTANLTLKEYNAVTGYYEYRIDWSELPDASDLWLFYQVTEFGEEWEKLVVSLTAGFDGAVFYDKLTDQNALVIKSKTAGEVSARFSADRFDADEWSNVRPDQDTDTTHFTLPRRE